MTITAAAGGLLFGFGTAVVSGTDGRLEELYRLAEFWLGATVASGQSKGSLEKGARRERLRIASSLRGNAPKDPGWSSLAPT